MVSSFDKNRESTDDSKNKNSLSSVSSLTQEKMMQTLDWAYENTLNGLPGQKDINDLVQDYLNKYESEVAIRKLISFQKTKAATSGFLAGLGGVVTLPVAVPANVASVILIQLRMIAAIAIIRGYNLHSDQVKTFVYATLAGTSVADISKQTGIVIGTKMLESAIKNVPGKTLTKINQAVGFRLITKFGSKGAINLMKMLPVAGGLFGGGIDLFTTTTIATLATNTFTNEGISLGNGEILEKSNIEGIE